MNRQRDKRIWKDIKKNFTVFKNILMVSGGEEVEAVHSDADLAKLKRCRAGCLGEETKRLKSLEEVLATEQDLPVVEEHPGEAMRLSVSLSDYKKSASSKCKMKKRRL